MPPGFRHIATTFLPVKARGWIS